MRVSLLVTCLVDLFAPEVGLAVVGLLRRHGPKEVHAIFVDAL